MREDPGLSLYEVTFIGLFFLNYVLLSFSVFYCNVRLIQFNVYFNHHLHTFLSRKTYYISVGKTPVGDTQTIADRLPIGDTKHLQIKQILKLYKIILYERKSHKWQTVWPPVSGKDVGSARRDDDHERQVRNGEIQQQEIGHSAHARFGHNDVNDETVSGDAEGGHDAVENRDSNFVQKESEIVVRRWRAGGHVVGNPRRHCWRCGHLWSHCLHSVL